MLAVSLLLRLHLVFECCLVSDVFRSSCACTNMLLGMPQAAAVLVWAAAPRGADGTGVLAPLLLCQAHQVLGSTKLPGVCMTICSSWLLCWFEKKGRSNSTHMPDRRWVYTWLLWYTSRLRLLQHIAAHAALACATKSTTMFVSACSS